MGVLHEGLSPFMIIYSLILLRMGNISDKICRKRQNIHFMFSTFFFPRKLCLLWGNVEKYIRARHATDGDMAHAHCILDI